jgi:hypothetical protein
VGLDAEEDDVGRADRGEVAGRLRCDLEVAVRADPSRRRVPRLLRVRNSDYATSVTGLLPNSFAALCAYAATADARSDFQMTCSD